MTQGEVRGSCERDVLINAHTEVTGFLPSKNRKNPIFHGRIPTIMWMNPKNKSYGLKSKPNRSVQKRGNEPSRMGHSEKKKRARLLGSAVPVNGLWIWFTIVVKVISVIYIIYILIYIYIPTWRF